MQTRTIDSTHLKISWVSRSARRVAHNKDIRRAESLEALLPGILNNQVSIACSCSNNSAHLDLWYHRVFEWQGLRTYQHTH